MRRTRATITILGFLSLAFSAREARAFCRSTTNLDPPMGADGCPSDGLPLYWKSECVGIHVDQAASRYLSLDAARQLLADAFRQWTDAGGSCVPSIVVVPLEPRAAPKVAYDPKGTNENVVVFRDDVWPYHDASTLDHVTMSFEHDTGALLDADIELNGAFIRGHLSEVDGGAADPASLPTMRRLFLHTAGHFLGFAHSPDFASIMYPLLSPGDDRPPVLTADDAAGMCAAYPSSSERPTLDGKGRPVTVAATACALGSEVPPSPCSSGSLRLDHGCSLGRRSSREQSGVLLGAGLIGLLWVRARGRRRVRDGAPWVSAEPG